MGYAGVAITVIFAAAWLSYRHGWYRVGSAAVGPPGDRAVVGDAPSSRAFFSIDASRHAVPGPEVSNDDRLHDVPTEPGGPIVDPAHLTHPAILVMSEYYGEDPAILVEEFLREWPDLGLLDSEIVTPPGDWNEIEPFLEEYFLGITLGDSDEAREFHFESGVLEESLDDYLARQLAEDAPASLLDARRAECRRILEAVRPFYDAMVVEWVDVIATIVRDRRYDRWPYATLTKRRVNTEHQIFDLVYAHCGGIPGGHGWIVGFTVRTGDFPIYDAARAEWFRAKDRCAAEIRALLAN